MEQKHNTSFESKRAMATAALFTEIFQKYLDSHKCENIPESASDELEQFSSEILDHVIIVGGFCRDVLLNRPINDIDIIINLRELCKLQTNHLKKYHSKKSDQDREARCVYWQRYLEKFTDDALNEQQKHNKEMVAMHNLNYIFNSKFWLKILKQDDLLDNKLSVKDVPDAGFVSAEIVNTVQYGGINLDKQAIDMIDTFSIDKCYNEDFLAGNLNYHHFHRKSRQLSISGMPIDTLERLQTDQENAGKPTPGGDVDGDEDAKQKPSKSRPEVDNTDAMDEDDVEEDEDEEHHGHDHEADPHEKHGHDKYKQRLKSMAIIEFDIDDLGGDFGDFGMNKGTKSRQEYIAIEVPIYSGKVRYKLLNYDFSINTGILPLSNIIKLKEYNNEYNHLNNSNQEDDPMTWLEIVENGLGECDAIEDCQINKILRCPEEAHEHCTIEAHPMTFVFWRMIRWMIREPSFTIHERMIEAQKRDYQNWLTAEWFDKEKNCRRFMKRLNHTLETECNSIADVKQMLKIMDQLEFNDEDSGFTKVMNELPSVRHALSDSLSAVNNDNLKNSGIIKAFKEIGYPVEEQLFKIPSKVEEELEKVKVRKNFLEEEVAKKDQRIEDLEKQNDRLLKEVQYLQQLNQQNDRVKELESQNSRLLQEVALVNDSKLKLAINANETIDQLRKYLIEYQNAVITNSSEQQ